nr:hypothetical protein [Tanacetum cinerariifolium]
MEKGFLTAKGRVSGKDVKEKHNSVLDDSGTASHMVNEGISSPYTVASHEEPKSRPRFSGNTLYGFFLAKHMAYPVVENYVKITWSKFGLAKLMMTNESGHWMQMLWWRTFVTSLFGRSLKNHDIPITVFTKYGLNVIATKLDKPLMLDSYTTTMCTGFWGRASYVGAMVELQANVELKDTIVVFGHVPDDCPKQPVFNVLKNLKNPRQDVRGVWHLVALNSNPIKERFNNLERQMMDGKLMLVDDDGKQLNKVDYAPVNSNSNSDVEVVYSQTAHFMTGRCANDASLYEEKDYDIYDTYDIHGLTIQELSLCDMMDINLLVALEDSLYLLCYESNKS